MLGLRDVLVRAREVRELADPSPLVTAALHRFLLAVLHRNFGPATFDDWGALWARGQWDAGRLGGYFDRWGHRFNLFDEAQPFYQVPQMPDAELHPIQLIPTELSSGNNPTLFDHSYGSAPLALTPAEAARYLIARQAYSLGGGVSRPFNFSDAPLARGYGVLAAGDNLFETLALNLLVYNEERPLPWLGEDMPAWERDELPQPQREGTRPLGYLDYLTWQSRRISLVAVGDSPLVVRCQILQGLKLVEGVLDPFKAYTRREETGYVPRIFTAERAPWRDSHALFQRETDDNGSRPAEVFNSLARVNTERKRGRIEAKSRYSFSALGMATEPGRRPSYIGATSDYRSLWRT